MIRVTGKTVTILKPFVYYPKAGSFMGKLTEYGLPTFKGAVTTTCMWRATSDNKFQPVGVALLAANKLI